MGRGRSRGPYGGRRQGLTGNQLKILGIVAILIDNIGAVVIQGGILHGTDSALYHAVLLAPSGHYWVIAGQVCRYVGRLGFPILAYLTVEEFVRTRDRRWYAVRMLLFALLSEVPFDLAVYHTMYYPHYQNMMFTLFAGVLVMAVMESTQNPCLKAGALAAGCALSWVLQFDYNVVGVLFIAAMYWFRRSDTAQVVAGVAICAVESISCYCVSALSFAPIVLYNGRRGAFQLKYMFYVFYPVHFLVLYGVSMWIAKGV